MYILYMYVCIYTYIYIYVVNVVSLYCLPVGGAVRGIRPMESTQTKQLEGVLALCVVSYVCVALLARQGSLEIGRRAIKRRRKVQSTSGGEPGLASLDRLGSVRFGSVSCPFLLLALSTHGALGLRVLCSRKGISLIIVASDSFPYSDSHPHAAGQQHVRAWPGTVGGRSPGRVARPAVTRARDAYIYIYIYIYIYTHMYMTYIHIYIYILYIVHVSCIVYIICTYIYIYIYTHTYINK